MEYNHEFRIEYELNYRNHVVRLLKISEYLEKCAGVCIASISKISNRSYYAWGISRSQKYLLKFVTNDRFYKETADSHTGVSFSEDQLQELIEIIEPSLETLKNIITENYNDGNIRNLFVKKKESSLHDYDTSKSQHSLLNSVYENDAPSEHVKTISSEYPDSNFFDNSEVDFLWLQMLSFKNSRKREDFTSDIYSVSSPIANFVELNDHPIKDKGNLLPSMPGFHDNEIQFNTRMQNTDFEVSGYSDLFFNDLSL